MARLCQELLGAYSTPRLRNWIIWISSVAAWSEGKWIGTGRMVEMQRKGMTTETQKETAQKGELVPFKMIGWISLWNEKYFSYQQSTIAIVQCLTVLLITRSLGLRRQHFGLSIGSANDTAAVQNLERGKGSHPRPPLLQFKCRSSLTSVH